MRTRSWTRAIAGLFSILALVALGACAAGGMGGGSGANTTLVVENNLIPPTSLSVYAVPDVGSRRLVGVVNPGATSSLRFDAGTAAGQFRFVAETTSGADIASNPLLISPGATVRWDVSANIATTVESG